MELSFLFAFFPGCVLVVCRFLLLKVACMLYFEIIIALPSLPSFAVR